VVMTFSVLFTFTDFQLIWVLTRGGPLNATHLMATLSFQRAILVQGRRTRPITLATAIEVASVALLFTVFGFGLDWVGATAAFAAFLGGRILSNAYLVPRCAETLRRPAPEEPAPAGTASS